MRQPDSCITSLSSEDCESDGATRLGKAGPLPFCASWGCRRSCAIDGTDSRYQAWQKAISTTHLGECNSAEVLAAFCWDDVDGTFGNGSVAEAGGDDDARRVMLRSQKSTNNRRDGHGGRPKRSQLWSSGVGADGRCEMMRRASQLPHPPAQPPAEEGSNVLTGLA